MARREDVVDESTEELIAWGLEIESGLSKWEIKFLEDVDRMVKADVTNIGKNRRVKLEQIIIEKG